MLTILIFLELYQYCGKTYTFCPEDNAGGKLSLRRMNVLSQYHTYFLRVSKTFSVLVVLVKGQGSPETLDIILNGP